MRIGIFVGSVGSGATIEDQIQQVIEAENDGFDSFWAAQVRQVDAMTIFALAGQRTERIQMGTAVAPIFTRHPIVMAQQALTTNAATNGRLNLGIGLSHKPTVENSFGLTFERPALRMQEYLTIVNGLINEGTASFRGEMYSVDTTLNVPSASPFPVLVAALAPRMLRIAGELAEGTITWMCGPKTIGTHIVPKISEAASNAGKLQPRVCVGLPVAVTDDVPPAFEKAANVFSHYGELPSYRRMLDIEGVESPGEIALIGNESQVESQLRAFADAGATEILASIIPVGENGRQSYQRTRTLLKSLVGKI
jgi:F420-dependent oxidoreductase-like protein